jgi:hypothetical protein
MSQQPEQKPYFKIDVNEYGKSQEWYKPTPKNRIRELQKAGKRNLNTL